MSTWTRERHEEARSIGFGFSFYEPGICEMAAAAVTEIERHRPDLAGPAPEDRDEKVARFARRLWAAAIEVSEGDTTPVPAFEDMTPRERDALTAITDSVVSAITVLLSSRQPAPEENL